MPVLVPSLPYTTQHNTTQYNEDRSVAVINMTVQNDFSSSNRMSRYIVTSGVVVVSEANGLHVLSMKQGTAVLLYWATMLAQL